MINMFRPARMSRLDCIIAEEKKTDLINELHKTGIAQIEHFGNKSLEKMKVSRDEPLDHVVEISDTLVKLRKMAETLSVFEPMVEKNILADMLGVDYTEKKKITRKDFHSIKEEADKLIEKYEDDVSGLSAKIQDKANKLSALNEKIRAYSIFKKVDDKTENYGESRFLYSVIGTVPQANLEILKQNLQKNLGNNFILESMNGDKKAIISAASRKGDSEKMDTVLRDSGFENAKIEGNGKISDIVKQLENDIKEYEKEISEEKQKLKSIYEKIYKNIQVYEELLGFEKEKCEVFIGCAKTRETSIMRMWVPRKQADEAEKIIKRVTDDKCVIDRDDEVEDAPIKLENMAIARPFQGLTKMFGLPKYNEIDPTFFIAPTFCIFFGFMLTDAIYGLILIIAGVVTEKTMGKRSENAKSAGFIMIGSGLAAIFFGVMTGSYLGDFIAKSILSMTPNRLAVWLDPMFGSNAMTVLLVTIVIGFIHIMFGHLLGIYDTIRRKEKEKAIFEHAAWYVLVGGIALAAMPMMGMLPEMYMYVGGVVGIAGLLMLVKGLGFMAFIDLIGLVGNTLSYARILAMALTTAGIAMSFNFLAGMAYQIPYIGIVVGAVIFIFGHVINILINSLGAFVHSLRLQYVEHFGSYYEGGGKEFVPFRENRLHTYVKE